MGIRVRVTFTINQQPKTVEEQRELEDRIRVAVENNAPLYFDDPDTRVHCLDVRSYFSNGRDPV